MTPVYGRISAALPLIIAVALGVPARAHAQSARCDAVLLGRTLFLASARSTEQLSWLKIVNENNYEQIKHDAGADVPEYFSGTYKDFDEKRKTVFQRETFNRSTDDSRSIVRSFLPESAVSAWRDCVLQDSSNLVTWIDKVDSSGATIGISWKPAPGLGKLRHPTLTIDGATGVNPFANKADFVGTLTFAVKRTAADTPVRGAVSGVAGAEDASFSSDFYVPVPNSAAVELAALRHAFGECCGSGVEWQHLWVQASKTPNFKEKIEAWVNGLGPRFGGLQAGLSGGDDFHIFARADHAGTKWTLTYLTPSADPEWVNNLLLWARQRRVQIVAFNNGPNLWYFKLAD